MSLRCLKSKFPIGIIVFYDHDLIVNLIQALSPLTASLVIHMLRISNVSLFQNVFSATIEAIICDSKVKL